MCNCTSGYDEIERPDEITSQEIFFIIFVDRIFTTLLEWLFTKLFDVTARTTGFLACIARATPINSLAT
jgi:hypothetical protein